MSQESMAKRETTVQLVLLATMESPDSPASPALLAPLDPPALAETSLLK